MADIDIKILPDNIVSPIFETKIVKRVEAITGDPFWWSYFWEIVRSGEASALCGLPKRDYTEIIDDPKTGNKILRYIKTPPCPQPLIR